MGDDPDWFSDLLLHSLCHVLGGFGRSGPQRGDDDDDDDKEEMEVSVAEHLSE